MIRNGMSLWECVFLFELICVYLINKLWFFGKHNQWCLLNETPLKLRDNFTNPGIIVHFYPANQHELTNQISSYFYIGGSKISTFEYFHNSRLIRWIQQNNIYKNLDLIRDWTQIACLAVNNLNHYTAMFSKLLWGCNWILFMHGGFCPICLIHLIARKLLHFEKN